jgi:raffinose/stachyose/melibiose transport system substrate-binding protein
MVLSVVVIGASAETTITYMASQDWVMDAEMALGEKFYQETGIKVDYQIVPSDQYPNLMMTKLNAGECADIFGSQGGQFDIVTQLNVEKNALDLSGEAWASTVDPLAAAQLSVGGKLYGQPIQDLSSVWAIAYNKQIFSKLGLSVPTNYAEFKAVCQAIKDSGVTPIYECVADGWHHVLWFPEMGVALENAEPGLADKLNKNETTFEQSSAAATLLTQIKEMVDLGFWGDNYMANTYADGPKNFASGQFAMMVANQGFPTEVKNASPDFKTEDIGFFVIPLLDNQILNVNPVGPSRFVYSGSKNADAAKQYLAYIARPENLQYLIDNVPKYNTLSYTGLKDKYSDEIKAFYAAYPKHGTVYQTLVKYLNPQWMEIGKELTAMLQGDETVDQVLKNIDRNRADQAAAAKDENWK